MSFRTPEALWLLLLAPLAAALLAHAARRRREAVRLFFGGDGDAGAFEAAARVRRWRAGLLVGAVALAVVALAGPRYGTAVREAQQESLDLVVALDVSASMLAEDVAPNRLARAKLAIGRLAEARQGDRLGLVVFAGDAFLQCPLTADRSAFRLFLDAADPSLIGTPGTDFARALFTARQAFDDEGADGPRSRALVVVSDGEDHEGGLDDAADALRENGVALFAVGVGTDEGAPVPVMQNGRQVGYKVDGDGQRIVSRLEDGVLRQLAGDGDLVRLPEERISALAARLDRLERTATGTEEYEASAERYQWPLFLALLLLLAERLLALRRPTTTPQPA